MPVCTRFPAPDLKLAPKFPPPAPKRMCRSSGGSRPHCVGNLHRLKPCGPVRSALLLSVLPVLVALSKSLRLK
jgi:hypothetical protein